MLAHMVEVFVAEELDATDDAAGRRIAQRAEAATSDVIADV
jgi:hypothetical protein